ncbi:MAG: polyribonucleotide nucleotidyltransferase, partial [Actinobacteria bacterium]|nr:polyribonucleotide nucleotidyltransferase [Actinomycetota bacterium]
MAQEGKTSRTTIKSEGFKDREIVFETGRLARLAGGSATVYLDEETMLLSATTASKSPRAEIDFFPLTIDVEERMYAVGRIPGSFFRREGRPTEDAILACRLIDRPLRPSFVDGLRNEVQVVVTVLSLHPDHQYDVLAISAASMSTMLAGVPFSGPVAGVRMALIDGKWMAFPTHDELKRATFDMVVAGRTLPDGDVAVMMVEAEAPEATFELIAAGGTMPTEQVVSAGLDAAKPYITQLCKAQSELASQVEKTETEFPIFADYQTDIYDAVSEIAKADISSAMTILSKADREAASAEISERVKTALAEKFPERTGEIKAAIKSLTKQIIRERVLRDQVRIDGRGLSDLRQLSAEVHVVPRAHGSALFERGETQVLGVTTLNMLTMEQKVDSLLPNAAKRYMHNYNMPPYSTGETGRVGTPKRREIGHGALAERALVPVLPTREQFPYAIRQVSEAIASNGSTSMASVCAATMSLLSAGVPLRAMVGGIAMGLISDQIDGETRYVALTDILGAEDAFGDMDFKVAGTKEMVTALQLDTKLDGIPASVLQAALGQAKDARLAILKVMEDAIDTEDEMSVLAPRIMTVKIPVDKIGEVIGPKGKMINQIQADTGATISIEDDGTVYIGATNGEAAEAARAVINGIANPQMPEVGENYLGTVVKLAQFGAFISLLPGKDGLLHVSQVRKLAGGKRVDNVEDVLSIGQKVQVRIVEIDPRG